MQGVMQLSEGIKPLTTNTRIKGLEGNSIDRDSIDCRRQGILVGHNGQWQSQLLLITKILTISNYAYHL